MQQSSPATASSAQGDVHARIQDYLAEWSADSRQVRPFFIRLLNRLADFNARLAFFVRQGVSASLRAHAPGEQAERSLFCLVDVVEDQDGPWLSVCFYADAVTDPEDLGNLVPSGLLGEDGHCFDVEEPDKTLEGYVFQRIQEALRACATDVMGRTS